MRHQTSHGGGPFPLRTGLQNVCISATATFLPDTILTNQAIIEANGLRVSAQTMQKMVGVSERRVASLGLADSDLLANAARRCLASAGVSPSSLGKILVTKFLGDRILPMTASLVQRKLDCDTAVQAFDIDGGIHSFVQALEVAVTSMAIGEGPVLVLSGGIINRLISRTDPRVAFQYGDGTAAVLLEPTEAPRLFARSGFSNLEFIEHSRGFSIREAVPGHTAITPNYAPFYNLYRQSDHKPAREFIKTAMKRTADDLLDQVGRKMADVSLVLVTETNHHLHTEILTHLEIPPSRTLSLLSRYGNTMSAMLPIMLDEAIRTRRVTKNDLVMLLSVGEGLSGGGVLFSL